MANNKIIRVGPVALSTTATNILTPPTLSGSIGLAGTNSNAYILIRRIRIINTGSTNTTYSLFIGATGGSAVGTEFMGGARTVYAGSCDDFYCYTRLDVGDFLTGRAGITPALVFEASVEIGVA